MSELFLFIWCTIALYEKKYILINANMYNILYIQILHI